MPFFFLVLGLFAIGGILALLCGRNLMACKLASIFSTLACTLGFGLALTLLLQGKTLSAELPIVLPLGKAVFVLDPLSCFFLLPVFFIGFFSSLILPERLQSHELPVHYGRQCFFFCAFLFCMSLVLVAAEAFFFLIAWECMSLAPFFLLAPEDKNANQRYASWIYLIVAHLGALPLLLLFASMSQETGSGLFAHFHIFASTVQWQSAGLFFVLALLGFGMKMGLAPLHVWMPEAHSLAPVDVTILLSGTMVNIGLYGILRTLSLLGLPAEWWAYALMGMGALSGLLGIIFALAQTNLKRSLAFSSSDNMGIVALGIGAGILSALDGTSLATVFFFAGALLHVWNHSIFKGLLFLSGAAVVQATGTTTISHLGGLQKKMPVAGTSMAIGAAAISGLPPLNGFIGELLIYIGFALAATASKESAHPLIFWLGIFVLATIAGLSLLCFSRLYALIFLGAPRSDSYSAAKNTAGFWKLAMKSLAVCCFVASLGAPLLFYVITPVILQLIYDLQLFIIRPDFAPVTQTLTYASLSCAGFIALALSLVLAHRRKKQQTPQAAGPTWDCGYALPSARMQYTSGGFAQFPSKVLRSFMRAEVEMPKFAGAFPEPAKASFFAPDWILNLWGRTLFAAMLTIGAKAKYIQHGKLNAYVLYILITLIATLSFALGGVR